METEQKSSDMNQGHRYLIVKLAAIGDVIMALPMLEAIREGDKNANITWVCGRSVGTLLREMPIDKLIVVDENKILKGNKFSKVKEVVKLWYSIGVCFWDYIFVCHSDKRYRILTFFSRSKVIRYMHASRKRPIPLAGRFFSDEYVRMVLGNELYGKCEQQSMVLHKQIPLHHEIENLFLGYRFKVVLSPGGIKGPEIDAKWCRRWPLNYYRDLAVLLIKHGICVIVTGGSSDRWCSEAFSDLDIVDCIGKFTLLESLAIFQRTDLVITHDSGPLHLAGVAGTKIVGIFGPTSPDVFLPRGKNNIALWRRDKFACCPCYDGKYYAECKNNSCMQAITPCDVFESVKKILL